MSGTWETQNKVLPGAYLNFRTNAPISITPGDRGIVVILQEVTTGNKGDIYTITATEADYPDGVTDADKLLANESLKGANKVLVYNIGTARDADAVTDALTALRTIDFNVLVYPYNESSDSAIKTAIVTWLKSMREDEGVKCQAVLADHVADSEAVINVVQGVELEDGTLLTKAEVTAFVGGITAGANVNESNTAKRYVGAIDVVPRMTKTEMEAAVTAGKFIFKVDTAQNVTVVTDINSLTTVTVDKGSMLKKNRVIRTIDGISNDVREIYESNYIGKVNNNEDGRSMLRATLIEYFKELQSMSAIQNFTEDDVIVVAGIDKDSVLIECNVQPVDSIEKIYINVNLS